MATKIYFSHFLLSDEITHFMNLLIKTNPRCLGEDIVRTIKEKVFEGKTDDISFG